MHAIFFSIHLVQTMLRGGDGTQWTPMHPSLIIYCYYY